MKRLTPWAASALMLSVFATSSWAQEWSGSFFGQVMVPENEFKENTDGNSFGAGFQGGYRFGNSPIYLGGEINFALMGSDSRTVPISNTIQNVRVDVETSHTMAQILAVGRLIAPSGVVRPYVEVLGGGNLFTSTTVISNRSDGEEIASDQDHSSSAWTYGAGGGALIRVYTDNGANGGNDDFQLKEGYIALSVRYFSGAEAEYMSSGGVIVNEDNSVTYNKKRSPIEQWAVLIGFQARF